MGRLETTGDSRHKGSNCKFEPAHGGGFLWGLAEEVVRASRGDEIPALQRLVNSDILKQYILFHGPKYGNDLDFFFHQCQIAVSSLGMHRIGVANGETSNLKVREYCAKGIPFINGYWDRDLPDGFPYAYQVAANEDAIDMQRVIAFYTNLRAQDPTFPESLNAFAKQRLTWEAKLNVVVEWLQKK